MAAPTHALSSLLQRATLDDHEEVLQAADQVLKSSKSDSEAQFAKVVALLKLDRYNDALRVFESGGEKLRGSGRREYAYALYKAEKLEEAEEAIGTEKEDRGSLHVLAQVLYRSEKFEQAADIYKLLKANPGAVSNEENDLRINTGAVDAQLEWNGAGHAVQNKNPTRKDLEGFETVYNAACGSIARGELQKAEVLLSRAKDLCNSMDELTEEEKKIELLPIIVQQIFVLTRLGKTDQAKNLVSSIDINEIPDHTTRQIAQINSLPLLHAENPYLAQRIFSDTEKLAEADKPFTFQQSVIRKDAYILALNSLKHEGVARSTAAYIKKNAKLITSPQVAQVSVLNAAAHAKGQTGKAALKEILPLLEKRPTDVGLLLTTVQIYISLQNLPSATNTVESFIKRLEASSNSDDLDVRFNPGLVGTLASLYASQGRKSNVEAELLNAASYWRKSSKKPSPSLLRAAGAALLKSQTQEDLAAAGDIFSQLYTQDSNDKAALAGLVASYSTTQPDKITPAQIDSLPPVDRLISGIDAAALEDAGILTTTTTTSSSYVTPKKRSATSTANKDKPEGAKKVRTSRLPKDYDANKKPDPERWLPLRDRTYYKPKGKKGKAKAAGLTQGGVVAADDKAEAGKSAAAAPVSGGGGTAAAKKKKKGKGGKW